MAYTRGFASRQLLLTHFKKHGRALGCADPADYERRADEFLGRPLAPLTIEGLRVGGDVVRYNLLTSEFGVLHASGVIGTFYSRAARTERENLAYFQDNLLVEFR